MAVNVYEGKNIRNVGIVGHGGSGKTSLVSAILFDTGATNRLGRVDDGNAPTDYDEATPERLAADMCERLGAGVAYEAVTPGGAARAAEMIAAVLGHQAHPGARPTSTASFARRA